MVLMRISIGFFKVISKQITRDNAPPDNTILSFISHTILTVSEAFILSG